LKCTGNYRNLSKKWCNVTECVIDSAGSLLFRLSARKVRKKGRHVNCEVIYKRLVQLPGE
jgi:hypothetical protein